MKNSHCSHCGTRFANSDWPRVCPNSACGQETWENPTPVVVVLQPVEVVSSEGRRIGCIIGKRAIEPQLGKWSLISGYMGVRETAEDAVRREFREETGLEIAGKPRYAYSRHNEHGLLMLCFVIDEPMPYLTFLSHQVCAENSALTVYFEDTIYQLAFPLQSEFAHRWFLGEFDLPALEYYA